MAVWLAVWIGSALLPLLTASRQNPLQWLKTRVFGRDFVAFGVRSSRAGCVGYWPPHDSPSLAGHTLVVPPQAAATYATGGHANKDTMKGNSCLYLHLRSVTKEGARTASQFVFNIGTLVASFVASVAATFSLRPILRAAYEHIYRRRGAVQEG
jgi:hypothetical protein